MGNSWRGSSEQGSTVQSGKGHLVLSHSDRNRRGIIADGPTSVDMKRLLVIYCRPIHYGRDGSLIQMSVPIDFPAEIEWTDGRWHWRPLRHIDLVSCISINKKRFLVSRDNLLLQLTFLKSWWMKTTNPTRDFLHVRGFVTNLTHNNNRI